MLTGSERAAQFDDLAHERRHLPGRSPRKAVLQFGQFFH